MRIAGKDIPIALAHGDQCSGQHRLARFINDDAVEFFRGQSLAGRTRQGCADHVGLANDALCNETFQLKGFFLQRFCVVTSSRSFRALFASKIAVKTIHNLPGFLCPLSQIADLLVFGVCFDQHVQTESLHLIRQTHRMTHSNGRNAAFCASCNQQIHCSIAWSRQQKPFLAMHHFDHIGQKSCGLPRAGGAMKQAQYWFVQCIGEPSLLLCI